MNDNTIAVTLSLLIARMDRVVMRVEVLEEKAKQAKEMAAPAPAPVLLPQGTRVRLHIGKRLVWFGVVIPRPFDKPAVSEFSRSPLTYVMWDGTNSVGGYFPNRLEPLERQQS